MVLINIQNLQNILKQVARHNKLSEIYENRTNEAKEAMCIPLDITNLGDKELIGLLNEEIEFLKKDDQT